MSSPTPAPPAVLPLVDGDRLTRAEFERRYDAMPHLKKAELIRGVVHMPSPVRVNRHGTPHNRIGGWLFAYEAATPGTQSASDASVRLEDDSMPQPDALLFITRPRAGRASVSADDYVEGPPELVAEVAASSAAFDLGPKLEMYRESGVREYVVWLVLQQRIEWFVLRGGQYQPLAPHADGTLRSEAFPGLWLDPAAMAAGDFARAMAVLQQGVASPEHAAFIASLSP